jgi:transposase
METVLHPHENNGGGQLLDLDQWAQIRSLKKLGHSIRRIARDLEIDRNTVRKALRASDPPQYVRTKVQEFKVDPFLGYICNRAAAVGFNAHKIYEEIKKLGYNGCYTTVKQIVRPLRQEQKLIEEATIRFETPPGLQAQVDWGSKTVMIGGQIIRVHIFVMVLCYSRAIYVEFTMDEKLPTLIACHEHAFAWFGGIPEEILYDNPKTIVLDRTTANARINPKFEDFCRYYGYTPRLCRPYRARTKGKVESGVKYVKRSFLAGEEFPSLASANEQVLTWIREVADQRIHGTTHEQPAARFRLESLRPFTGRPPYILQVWKMRKVPADCLVSYATNRYSVPWKYVYQTVELQEQGGQISIYHQGALITTHRKAEGKYQVVMNPEHYRGISGKHDAVRKVATSLPEVEVRSLDVYAALAEGGAGAWITRSF